MKVLILTVLFSVFNFSFAETCHPVHFSVINMEYNESEEAFDISIKLFTDDLEKIIDYNNKTVLNLGKENQVKECNMLIDRYVKSNFVIVFDKKGVSKKLKQNKITVNNNDKATWIYYTLKSKKPHKVTVRNTLLNDLYNDQKNLFIFTCKKFQEAKKFEKNDTNLQFVVK